MVILGIKKAGGYHTNDNVNFLTLVIAIKMTQLLKYNKVPALSISKNPQNQEMYWCFMLIRYTLLKLRL